MRAQPKFLPLQTVIRKHFPGTTPPPPVAGALPAIPKVAYGNITFTAAALLFQNLEVFRMSALSEPQNMEELGQGYGYILYSVPATSDDAPQTQVLTAPGLADRGLVYRGSELQGVLGAWAATHTLQLNFSSNPPRAAPLRILVSNEGRQSGELVSLAKNAKGILGNLPSKPVMLGSTALHAMNATHIELPEPATSWSARLRWKPLATATASTISQTAAVPAFYKATLIATGVDATFLRMDGWGHGVVFVNDVNLGRFSCLGPGRSLYVPTGVLRAGANSIVILETDRLGAPPIPTGSRARTVESVQIGPLWASKPAVE
jgi:beta-galactosidase